MSAPSALHPDQFAVDEAWIAFRLNGAPVRTELDGEFDCLALMDAASCFLLAIEFVAANQGEPDLATVRRWLKQALSHKGVLPRTLFVSRDLRSTVLLEEAARRMVTSVLVADDRLTVFVGEARDGFRGRFETAPGPTGT